MPSEFKDGVKWFLKYAADPEKLTIAFPEGHVKCAYCKWLYNEHGLNRSRCRITDEIIYTPNYPELPESCPFQPTGEVIGDRKGD